MDPQTKTEEKAPLRKDPYFFIPLCLGIVFFILLISNLHAVNAWLDEIFSIVRPVVLGLIISYFANPIFRFFERKMLFRLHVPKLRRALSLLFTYLVLILIVALLFMLIVPQLYESILMFIGNAESYLNTAVDSINGFLDVINRSLPNQTSGNPVISHLDSGLILQFLTNRFKTVLDVFTENFGTETVSYIFEVLGWATTVVSDLIFGLFVSLYLLSSKEKRYAQTLKFRRAFFSEKTNERISRVVSVTNESFQKFLLCKVVDVFAVGILTYLSCRILGISYPILIAAIVGSFDIVPVIGPIVSAIPCVVLIFLTNPWKILPFLAAVILIQLIDNKFIFPKIVGEKTSISSLCILISVIVMGGIWGLTGLIVGVPLFAAIVGCIRVYSEEKLKEKQSALNVGNSEPTPESVNKGLHRRRPAKVERQITDGTGDLTSSEKLQFRSHALAKNLLFSKEDVTDEMLAQFAKEREAISPAVPPVSDPAVSPADEVPLPEQENPREETVSEGGDPQ